MAVVWAGPAPAGYTGPSTTRPGAHTEHVALSARQRKQVYMHSAVFDVGGAPQESLYAPSRQTAVWAEVKSTIKVPRQEREVHLPKPADMKATSNSGHGVVIWDGPKPAASPNSPGSEFVQFGQTAEPMRVVHANREDGIPREFRNTSSKLKWSDQRAERAHCRGREKLNERREMDASSRKHYELSSDLFGKAPRDGSQLRGARGKAEPASPPPERAQTPSSARERLSNNLNPSHESQFSVYAPTASAPQLSRKSSEEVLESRRRTERNFSDIFGKQSKRSSSALSPRTELHGTSNVDFLNFHCEISSRRRDRKPESQEGTVVYRPSCGSPERACWDTRSLMDSNAEIARRRREGRCSPVREARERSASERKRAELGSGQLRLGTGARPEPHDAAAGPSRTGSAQTLRVAESPLSRGGRGARADVRADSARARKQASLASEGLF